MKRNIEIREDELARIAGEWPLQRLNMPHYVNRWNSMGDLMGTADIPTDGLFLELIDSIGRPDRGTTVMEIGCGSGDHCFALSGKVKSVLGLDISPTIVENCRTKCREKGITNVAFEERDWFSIASGDDLVRNGADIVLAHYSPAVYSYPSFRTMLEATRRAGFVCIELNWSDPLYREAYDIGRVRTNGSCEYPLRMIDTLWHLGCSPSVYYNDRETSEWMDADAAADVLIEHISMFAEYDPVHSDEIREMVHSRAVGGKAEFRDRWTDTYICWEA